VFGQVWNSVELEMIVGIDQPWNDQMVAQIELPRAWRLIANNAPTRNA
jgi:hypothetical protein